MEKRRNLFKTFGNLWLTLGCVLALLSFAREDGFAQIPRSTTVSLYFMDVEELKLTAEKREISQTATVVEQVKLTIAELIKGPSTDLMPTIPEETEVRTVFLDEKGCAYVDFSRAISQNHPGGTTGELATIASIVNTLTANFPENIHKVQILIGGKEAESIAGHINISKPIAPFEFE
jgi:spore germination protein GerM